MSAVCCSAPPLDYDATVAEAEVRLQATEVQEAWDAAARARAADELRPEAYLVLVRLARRHDRCADAVPLFERRVALGGDDVAQFHYFLGLLQMDCDQRRQAEENLRVAIEMEPRSAMAYVELGGLLGGAGRFDEAIEMLREAAPRFAHRPEVDTRLGHMLIKAERWTEAERALTDITRRHPGHPRARFLLGLALIHNGELTRARAELESAVELQPGHAVSWYQLAYVYEQLGEADLQEQALARFADAYREHGASI